MNLDVTAGLVNHLTPSLLHLKSEFARGSPPEFRSVWQTAAADRGRDFAIEPHRALQHYRSAVTFAECE